MSHKNNIEIIVSRYNENLNWLNEFPFNQFEYIVYNKGDNDNFEKNNVKKIINLPNVGRCDHTYLFHLIENYDNLSDIIVFFPGSINIEYKKPKAIQLLSKIIENDYKNAYFFGSYHHNLRNRYKYFKLDSHKCSDPINYEKNCEIMLEKCKIRPYGLWYSYFFGNTIAHWSTLSGIFSIDKRDIIQHPKLRYQFLIETINKHSNPEAGHYIERSWGVIFYPLIYTHKINY
jgi:hypothetical protein